MRQIIGVLIKYVDDEIGMWKGTEKRVLRQETLKFTRDWRY